MGLTERTLHSPRGVHTANSHKSVEALKSKSFVLGYKGPQDYQHETLVKVVKRTLNRLYT